MPPRVQLAGAVCALLLQGCAGAQARPPASAPSAACPSAMVFVRGGGPFELGMREGSRATAGDFCLDRTEVTAGAYAACASCGPAPETVDWPGISDTDRLAWSAACNGGRADRREHPVNCVSWAAADGFCRAAGKRLPTEVEWEWAARNGPAATPYPWGDAAPDDRVCWNVERGGEPGRITGTCPVGTHPAGDSAAGISDLGGNVWEWTSSPNGAGPERVTRGGGWYYNGPRVVSASYRAWHAPAIRSSSIGFRCAADPGAGQ